jgi:predicted ABC-type ATPase
VPVLTVIGGPNGSGKSTFTRKLEFDGRANLLDPDAVAKRINPTNLRLASIDAAREVIQRTREYLRDGQSFAIETTLSSVSIIETMRRARERAFVVRLVYVCVENPDWNIERVRERVAKGGHDVPDDDVRRRYERSLSNLPEALQLADDAVVYDNSGVEPQRVLETRSGVVVWRSPDEPAWVTRVRESIK